MAELDTDCFAGRCKHSIDEHRATIGVSTFKVYPKLKGTQEEAWEEAWGRDDKANYVPPAFKRSREEVAEMYRKAKSGSPVALPVVDPYIPTFGNPVAPWHRYFAWRPVHTVDRGYQWLCVVWRRRIQKKHFLNGGPDFWWQYAVDKGA